MLDKLVNRLLEMSAVERNGDKVQTLHEFKVERLARTLIAPAKKKATHHRDREKHYTKELEKAEKVLRQKGISLEVFDWSTGTMKINSSSVASGRIDSPSATFQPTVDQRMLDTVKNAKNKMLEHRGKAEWFGKLACAFACSPDSKISLTVEDVHSFGGLVKE